jgi:hypothetical protein
MEFSKKIVRVSWGVNIAILLLITALPIFQVPVDGLVSALPYSWGELAVVQGFYLWKAKCENRHKYAMKYMDKIAKKFDPDFAVRIAEIVLKD